MPSHSTARVNATRVTNQDTTSKCRSLSSSSASGSPVVLDGAIGSDSTAYTTPPIRHVADYCAIVRSTTAHAAAKFSRIVSNETGSQGRTRRSSAPSGRHGIRQQLTINQQPIAGATPAAGSRIADNDTVGNGRYPRKTVNTATTIGLSLRGENVLTRGPLSQHETRQRRSTSHVNTAHRFVAIQCIRNLVALYKGGAWPVHTLNPDLLLNHHAICESVAQAPACDLEPNARPFPAALPRPRRLCLERPRPWRQKVVRALLQEHPTRRLGLPLAAALRESPIGQHPRFDQLGMRQECRSEIVLRKLLSGVVADWPPRAGQEPRRAPDLCVTAGGSARSYLEAGRKTAGLQRESSAVPLLTTFDHGPCAGVRACGRGVR